MSKKLKEMNVAADVGGYAVKFPAGGKTNKYKVKGFKNLKSLIEKTLAGSFEPTGVAAVYAGERNPNFNKSKKPSATNRPLRRIKEPKPMKSHTIAQVESKAETTLRETIRELIFLNKIKFYEEQTKEALHENKLRKIIRYLISEAEDKVFDTTGQNFAANILSRLKVTFETYKDLSSSREQKERFKRGYLEGIKSVLDSEDNASKIFSTQAQQVGTPPPAKRSDVEEQEGAEGEEIAEPTSKTGATDDALKKMAKQAAFTAIGIPQAQTDAAAGSEVTAIQDCLDRDIPEIVKTYRSLSEKEFSAKGRTTSDRKDFRLFLIGGRYGNIQVEFDKIDGSHKAADEPAETQPTASELSTTAKEAAPAPAAAPAAPAVAPMPADLETPQ